MSDEKHEAHAEIIAEMRFHAQQNIDAEKGSPTFGILTMEGKIAKDYADRAEAAHKREVEALTAKLEVAKRCWKVWSDRADELLKTCNEQYARLKTVGNAAKLREVVGDLLYMAERYVKKTPATESVIFDAKTKKEIRTVNYYDVIAKAQAALAAPPRNCGGGEPWNRMRGITNFANL